MNNSRFLKLTILAVTLLAINRGVAANVGEPLTILISAPARIQSGYFTMGTPRRPDGMKLSLKSRNLLLDGKP
jgi:hypothetical protein